jgi:hypothetical protein
MGANSMKDFTDNDINEMEQLLRSARRIAARKGDNTDWDNFDACIAKLGISNVTPRVYKLLLQVDESVFGLDAKYSIELDEKAHVKGRTVTGRVPSEPEMQELPREMHTIDLTNKALAWCSRCAAYQPYSGDPNSIHLHLCNVCDGVVDDTDNFPASTNRRIYESVSSVKIGNTDEPIKGAEGSVYINSGILRNHDLFKTGDADAPDVIKDRNGDVVLGLCRVCGQAECELDITCPGRKSSIKQYYCRREDCTAPNSRDPNCVCWHDEGTGPYPTAATSANLRWRDKPNTKPENRQTDCVFNPEHAQYNDADLWALLPKDGAYLDLPDGGQVPLLEQLRRMAADAAKWREFRAWVAARE